MKSDTFKRHVKMLIREEYEKFLKDKAKELEENKKAKMLEELIYIVAEYNHGIYPRVDANHTVDEVKEFIKDKLVEWGQKHKLYKKEIFDENFNSWNLRYKVYMFELLELFAEKNKSTVRLNEVPTEEQHPALPEDYDKKERKKKDKEWDIKQNMIPGEKS